MASSVLVPNQRIFEDRVSPRLRLRRRRGEGAEFGRATACRGPSNSCSDLRGKPKSLGSACADGAAGPSLCYSVPISDLCLLRHDDSKDRIITWAPQLCVEVLSEDDRLHELQMKVDEFAALGVKNIWVLDPWKRIAYYASPQGFQQPGDGELRVAGTEIAISPAEVFAELDEG